jgi:high-affinity iron transporter
VESSFSAARAALADRVPPEELETSIERIKTRMAAATTDRAPVAPFAAAFLVFFREGVEAALLVAALLTGVRRLGRRDAARFIHLGWMAALPAGVATWWLFQRLVSIGADRRELVEALVAIAAAIVLFSVSFWMISKAESRHWMAYLKRNLERALGARNVFLLSSLAFLAVYREAAETVLFLQALVLEAGSHSAPVLWGVAVALLAVVACAYVLSRAIHRLPLGPFFAVSGVLLCLLAVSFAGSGIHTLVASGHIAPRPVRFPEVPWLGIHPDLSSLVVQIAIVLTVAAAGIVTLTRAAATPRVPAGNKSPR